MRVPAAFGFTPGGCEREKQSPHAAVHGKVTHLKNTPSSDKVVEGDNTFDIELED